MQIKVTFSESFKRAHARLRDDAGLMKTLAAATDTQNELTVAHIQEKKLSSRGPDTLGVRTGRLRRSIRPSKAAVSGMTVLSGIGSNVRYLGPHEFGFEGDVQVHAYMRRSKKRAVIFGKRRKVLRADIEVKGHKRHVSITARAPLKRGIKERLREYGTALGRAGDQFYAGR